MTQAWGYIRYSTEKQGENSVERQMDAIQRWARRFRAELVAVSFDLEKSRTLEHTDREGLLEAIGRIQSGAASVLIAESVSRFAGDPGILHGIKKAIGKKNRVATANDSGDNDMDEDRQDFEAIFSRYEIRQIRARTRGAIAMKRMRNERSGQVPYGKRLKADGQHTGGCKGNCNGCLHWEDCPVEMAMLTRLFQLKGQGYGCRVISHFLKDEGFRGKSGNVLDHCQVQRILDRAVRAG